MLRYSVTYSVSSTMNNFVNCFLKHWIDFSSNLQNMSFNLYSEWNRLPSGDETEYTNEMENVKTSSLCYPPKKKTTRPNLITYIQPTYESFIIISNFFDMEQQRLIKSAIDAINNWLKTVIMEVPLTKGCNRCLLHRSFRKGKNNIKNVLTYCVASCITFSFHSSTCMLSTTTGCSNILINTTVQLLTTPPSHF